VVHITTPPKSHLPLSRLALDAGCHIYVEKPLALNHGDAKALIDAVATAGRKMTIGYTYLFDPRRWKMRAAIESVCWARWFTWKSWFGYNLAGQFGSAILGDSHTGSTLCP